MAKNINNDYGDGYHFQEVFFKGHPVNKQNPNPIPPKPPKPDPPPPPPPPEQPEQNNRTAIDDKPKKKKKHGLLKFLLTVILIAVLAVLGYVVIVISRFDYTRENPDTASIIEEVGELKSDDKVQNIMIFGADNHAEDENGRSDTMLLISIDRKHHVLKQTSFMRDLYLPIPGYEPDKLNAAFAIGGAKLAVETIEYNFGIKIDSYIVVEFDSFISIVNTLGGIDMELTAEEVDYIDWQSHKNKQVADRNELNYANQNYYENEQEEKVAIVHLNGRQALWHARNRGEEGICSGDDFVRTSRQRETVNAILTKMKSANPFTLAKMLYDIAPMITTNMDLKNAFAVSVGMIRYLGYDRMEFRIPQSFNYSSPDIDGQSVLTIDNLEEEKNALYEFIFNQEKEEPDTSDDDE